MSAEKFETIRIRAYEIWEAAGRPDGQAEDHWLQAMSEMASSPSMMTPDEPAPKRTRKSTAKAKPVVEVAVEPEPEPAPKKKKKAKASV